MITDKYYTVAEACEALSLTRQRVCALIKSGQLSATKVHPMLWIIPAKALDDFKRLDRPTGRHIGNREKPQRKAPSRKPRRSA